MVLMDTTSVRDRVRQSAVIREEKGLSILTFHAMGTRCRVSLVEPSRSAANAYLDHLLNWVADFEAHYSRFLDNSLISRINAAAGQSWVEVDLETDRLLAMCAEFVFFTRGAFDPTALPLIRLWNWKANPPVIPTDSAISAARVVPCQMTVFMVVDPSMWSRLLAGGWSYFGKRKVMISRSPRSCGALSGDVAQ